MLEPDDQLTEAQIVIFRRFNEARDAGLSPDEALPFAEGDTDIGLLRHLVDVACPPHLIAGIVI